MNRRYFIKAAALAAVAVPVVGGLATVSVPSNKKWVWVVKCERSSKHGGHGTGTGITTRYDQAIDWYLEWVKQGYTVTVRYMPLAEARF